MCGTWTVQLPKPKYPVKKKKTAAHYRGRSTTVQVSFLSTVFFPNFEYALGIVLCIANYYLRYIIPEIGDRSATEREGNKEKETGSRSRKRRHGFTVERKKIAR